MKSVLISIRPEWCEKIANKVKSLEIRKTIPKLKPPFKVYIYCTSGPPYLNSHNGYVYLDESDRLGFRGQGLYRRLNPGIIGEFVCDRIDYWNYHIHDNDTITLERASELSRVSEDELLKYADLGHFYAWHISDLVIYEHPMELGMFAKPDKCPYNLKGECAYPRHCYRAGQTKRCGGYLERPPQSWCYVEEVTP
jgi:predicted transcriptional regulator